MSAWEKKGDAFTCRCIIFLQFVVSLTVVACWCTLHVVVVVVAVAVVVVVVVVAVASTLKILSESGQGFQVHLIQLVVPKSKLTSYYSNLRFLYRTDGRWSFGMVST